MGMALTFEFGIQISQLMHQKNKEGFGMQTKTPYDDETLKRGDL